MWNYEKRLQYPINITTPNAKIAQIIMSQYGGPDGEMRASIYNAMPKEGVEKLVEFMKKFEEENA